MIALTHEKIIVTSQYLPEQIWNDPATLQAINRRFTRREFKKAPEGSDGM